MSIDGSRSMSRLITVEERKKCNRFNWMIHMRSSIKIKVGFWNGKQRFARETFLWIAKVITDCLVR